MFSLGSTRVVFWYCVVISKIVLFSVYFVCFETILYVLMFSYMSVVVSLIWSSPICA